MYHISRILMNLWFLIHIIILIRPNILYYISYLMLMPEYLLIYFCKQSHHHSTSKSKKKKSKRLRHHATPWLTNSIPEQCISYIIILFLFRFVVVEQRIYQCSEHSNHPPFRYLIYKLTQSKIYIYSIYNIYLL